MEPSRQSGIGRTLAVGAATGLAVAATAMLVVAEGQALIRLAVITALWALLVAAFLVYQPRSAPSGAVAVGGAGEVELRVRREIESDVRADLAALRGDVERLRRELLESWGGELRVERVAVQSESTRVAGLGATLHALQAEARRAHDGDRLLAIPSAPALIQADPGEGMTAQTPQRAGGRAAHAFQNADTDRMVIDAAALLQRLDAEASPRAAPLPGRRHRRSRADGETNDVLSRLLGEQAGDPA